MATFETGPRDDKSSSTLVLCDIGVNLLDDMFRGIYNDKQYHQGDEDIVMRRAQENHVQAMIITCGTLQESIEGLARCRELRSKGFQVYTTIGIHPTRCNAFNETEDLIEQLERLIEDGKSDKSVVAIGECGLDYDRLHFCDKEVQKKGFDLQLQLATRHELPVFFHNRNTGGDFVEMVLKYKDSLRGGGVVHSFDGNLEEMELLTSIDLYIGINGCSLKTEDNLNVVKAIPLNKLMIETDAPWCGIKPTHASYKYIKTNFQTKKRDKYDSNVLVKDRCEPCCLVQVLEVLSAIREEDLFMIGNAIATNTENLFKLSLINSEI